MAMAIAFGTSVMDSGDEFVKEYHFNKADTVQLVKTKITDNNKRLEEKIADNPAPFAAYAIFPLCRRRALL